MILLDTNVVSESLRPRPSSTLAAWLDAQPAESIYLCTPVLAELYRGVLRLTEGRRKDRLRLAIERMENELFRGRILILDSGAAKRYGEVTSISERMGRPIGQMDALIAAIALSNQAALATRDVGDFLGLGLELVDPFESPGSVA
jgi:toxin FitB